MIQPLTHSLKGVLVNEIAVVAMYLVGGLKCYDMFILGLSPQTNSSIQVNKLGNQKIIVWCKHLQRDASLYGVRKRLNNLGRYFLPGGLQVPKRIANSK